MNRPGTKATKSRFLHKGPAGRDATAMKKRARQAGYGPNWVLIQTAGAGQYGSVGIGRNRQTASRQIVFKSNDGN